MKKRVISIIMILSVMLSCFSMAYADESVVSKSQIEIFREWMESFNHKNGTCFTIIEEDEEEFCKEYDGISQEEFYNVLYQEIEKLQDSLVQPCSVEGDASQMQYLGYSTYLRLNSHTFQMPPNHAIYEAIYGVTLVPTATNVYVIKNRTSFQINVASNRQTCAVSFTGFPYNETTHIALTLSIDFNLTYEAEVQ